MKTQLENMEADVQNNSNSNENWISRSMRRRYGVGMMLALLFWPFAGFVGYFESILRNGMLIDTYRQLAFLTFVNAIAIFFCTAIQRLLNSRFPGGWWHSLFGDGSQPWSKKRIRWTLGIATLTPLLLALFFGEEFDSSLLTHIPMSVFSIGVGLFFAWLILLLAGEAKCRLFGSDATTQNYFPFESQNRRGFGIVSSVLNWLKGIARWCKLYRLADWLGIAKVDTQFLTYLFLLAVFHWSTSRWLSQSETWMTSAPAMVVVLIWIVGMSIAGIANIFDRFRLPVVALIVLLLTVWLSFFESTSDLQTVQDNSVNHFITRISDVVEAENEYLDKPIKDRKESRVELIRRETSALEDQAWDSIIKRMKAIRPVDPERGKTLVVVTCPGGGIHAAAWSACVLDQLSSEYAEFSDSICLISGVSGGSVGTLMFVSSQYDGALEGRRTVSTAMPTTDEIHDALRKESPSLDLAARSSLEDIAYGITTDDLYGLLYSGLAKSDRGQRLEDGLLKRLPESQQNLTMGDWGDRALDGTVPIVVFNSTDAVSGRRVLFDTIPTPRRASSVGLTSRPLNYRELLSAKDQAMDVKPATAARTSATFPYVSPFTKPGEASPRGEAVAICDGGYVDNEGIVTAVNWIEFMLKRRRVWDQRQKELATEGSDAPEKEERPFDRILLLRIEPSHSNDLNRIPNHRGLAGWLRWLAGPAETMAKVRSASQLERGNLESDLAAWETGKTDAKGASTPVTQRPPSLLGNPAPQESADNVTTEVEEAEYRRRNASPEDNRKEWDDLIERYQESLKKHIKPKPHGLLTQTLRQAVQDNLTDDLKDMPVVILPVRFENADQVIPLNWKLSKRQKLWYLFAWSDARAKGQNFERHWIGCSLQSIDGVNRRQTFSFESKIAINSWLTKSPTLHPLLLFIDLFFMFSMPRDPRVKAHFLSYSTSIGWRNVQ